jgi:hypothetical protein
LRAIADFVGSINAGKLNTVFHAQFSSLPLP